MSSRLDVLRGVAEPQILHLPPDVRSRDAATEAIELAESCGLFLDESQRLKLRHFMGTRADGSWSAAEVADIESRQNGKGDTMIARQLYGLFVRDEVLQIATAHEFPTANEAFLRLVSWIESSDELRRLVARVRYANGEQGVELLNGCRLKYRARTGGSGRGFAGVSTIYYDEAMYLSDAHMAASRPALITHPDPQIWYASSAGLATSTPMWRLRKRALSGQGGRLAYCEHTAERVELSAFGTVVSSPPDPDDKKAWALANPTLGDRISVEAVEAERASMSTEMFLRERLGVWDAELGSEGGPWPPEVWNPVVDPSLPPFLSGAVGVEVAHDKSQASVAVAGAGCAELVDHRPGTAWIVPRILELRERHEDVARAPVAVDPSGPAAFVIADLERAGVAVLKVGGQAMGQACGHLYTSVTEGQIRVGLHADLNRAAASARTQPKGDSWVWARRDGASDVSPLVALTLAWWGSVQAASVTPDGGFFADWDSL